ncbi:hypothetical protein [Streptomyces sp. NPDC000410]|uniref:hypothetical protein n=1 Tax=Streptomyces sp. NPDC000410 TaxID=3154254 RepID=UPI00332B88B2
MSASQREEQPQSRPRPRHRAPSPSAFSMRDLLASCAAASEVSTPPRERDPGTGECEEKRRDAA